VTCPTSSTYGKFQYQKIDGPTVCASHRLMQVRVRHSPSAKKAKGFHEIDVLPQSASLASSKKVMVAVLSVGGKLMQVCQPCNIIAGMALNNVNSIGSETSKIMCKQWATLQLL
jgi:hypothetical protein